MYQSPTIIILALTLVFGVVQADTFDDVWGRAPEAASGVSGGSVLDNFIHERQQQDVMEIRAQISDLTRSAQHAAQARSGQDGPTYFQRPMRPSIQQQPDEPLEEPLGHHLNISDLKNSTQDSSLAQGYKKVGEYFYKMD